MMKSKRETVCHNCRAHKIGCDGKSPCCTQCHRTGRQCEGYRLKTVFIPYSVTPHAPGTSLRPLNLVDIQQTAKAAGQSHTNSDLQQHFNLQVPQSFNVASSADFVSVIVDRFLPKSRKNCSVFDTSTSQVCASWVEMLPSMIARPHSGELIAAATKAFGLIILDRGPEGKHESFHSIEAYVATLQKLTSTLVAPESFFIIETAAAIVCLAMVELMLPKPDSNILAHVGGLGALITMYSPEIFSSGDFHVIFVGCRPILLFQALNSRKSTFLGQEEWLLTPFRDHPPSCIQILIGDVAILPSILEQIDILQSLSPDIDIAQQKAHDLRTSLSEVLVRLSEWDGRFEVSEKPKTSFQSTRKAAYDQQDEVPDFWFPSLLAANVYTHMWAFQIICLTELRKVDLCLHDCDSHSGPPERHAEHEATVSALTVKICRSMEYLLQDEMLLFGPAAAIFPITTAYDVLIGDMGGNGEQIKHYRKFFERIRERGFLSASADITNSPGADFSS